MSVKFPRKRRNPCFVLAVSLLLIFSFTLRPQAKRFIKKEPKKEKPAAKPHEKEIIKNLEQKYRDFLDLVDYIMLPIERKIFLELTNDRDRDLYIDLFWSLRDPTPGTPENEFKDEHIKRFNYANYYYKFGAARPGWMTDQGRISILLGEPDSKDRYDNDVLVVPTQLWSYSGKGRPGLPSAFWVLFFKRDEVGEYKVYNPLTDGPYSLLRKGLSTMQINQNDDEAVYNKIANRHDILAMASLSLLPDEPSPDFRPTMSSELLLGNIYNLPTRQINANYANNFLKYKGIVKVDYSMNYIDNTSLAQVLRDPGTGLNFLHFAVLPKTVSVNYIKEKDKYYFNFRLDVSLKRGEETVFSYQKNFPFYLDTEKEAEEKYSASVTIADYIPVAYGDYELRVLVQNDVKKEFTYFERKVAVKPPSNPIPVLFGPLLSYEKKNVSRSAFLPFKIGDLEWTACPRSEFGREEKIYIFSGVDRCAAVGVSKAAIEIEDMNAASKFKWSATYDVPADQQLVYHVDEAGPLPPGNYRIRLSIFGAKGVTVAVSDGTFMVSTQAITPHPAQAFKITPADNLFHFYHALGYQYMVQDKLDEAQGYYEKAYQVRADFPNLIKDFCTLLQKKKDYDRMLVIAEVLKNHNETLFDYYLIVGRACYYKEAMLSAIENLQKANAIYDSNIEVLNMLGFSYLKTGNKAEAKKVLQASLKIYPDQKNIIEVMKKLD